MKHLYFHFISVRFRMLNNFSFSITAVLRKVKTLERQTNPYFIHSKNFYYGDTKGWKIIGKLIFVFKSEISAALIELVILCLLFQHYISKVKPQARTLNLRYKLNSDLLPSPHFPPNFSTSYVSNSKNNALFLHVFPYLLICSQKGVMAL